MSRANTTSLIVKTEDYMAAHLDNGGVRVGFIGSGPFFDFPEGHERATRAKSLTADTVEEFHDECMSIYHFA